MSRNRDYPTGKTSFIPIDDSLVDYAERRAKEMLGENLTYSPNLSKDRFECKDNSRIIKNKKKD